MNSLGKSIWSQLDQLALNNFKTITTLAPTSFHLNGDFNALDPFMVLYEKTRKQCFAYNLIENVEDVISDDSIFNLRYQLLKANYDKLIKNLELKFKYSSLVIEKVWALYLRDRILMAYGKFDKDNSLAKLVQEKKFDTSNYNFTLQILRNYVVQGDKLNSHIILDNLEKTICKESNNELAIVIQARIQKFKADLITNPNQRIDALKKALSTLERSKFSTSRILTYSGKEYEQFLNLETKRRVLDHLFITLEENFLFDEAKIILDGIEYIDPHCPRFLLMKAENYRKSKNLQEALSYYVKSILHGSLDRSYIYKMLSKITNNSHLKKIFMKKAQNENLHKVFTRSANENCLPYSIQENAKSSEFGRDMIDSLNKRIKRNKIFKSFSSFLTLEDPPQSSPLLTKTPILLYEAFSGNLAPWYTTLTCQRAMIASFRKELVNALISSIDVDVKQREFFYSIEYFATLSAKSQHIYKSYINSETLSAIQIAHLARLLASLGFFKEALEIISKFFLKKKIICSAHDLAYLKVTEYFIKGVLFQGQKDSPLSTSEQLFHDIPKTEQTLRMKFSLALNSCVLAGQRGLKNDCNKWREFASHLIAQIQSSDNFDDFEKNLLTSRFYRGVTYAPFLEKNYETLRRECLLIEKFAYAATPTNERQGILYKENLFPMLESCSRIYFFLGEFEKATQLMFKISSEVDPLDSKSWLQRGEIYDKKGQIDYALEAYLNSSFQGCPLGAIAWFKVGSRFEKKGEIDLAIWSQFESLNLWPNGATPLKRIQKISPDGAIKDWATTLLMERGKS